MAGLLILGIVCPKTKRFVKFEHSLLRIPKIIEIGYGLFAENSIYKMEPSPCNK